ncbi:MAG: AAA family ATPase [Sneathiella sp.]
MTADALQQQVQLQARLIAFLKENRSLWDTNSLTSSDIQQVETHGATVLLGQNIALKLKKPVLFDHMDYSTPAQRKIFCERELTLNKKGAPDLYDKIVPIGQRQDGTFALNGEPPFIDYLVCMRRFPEGSQMDQVAGTGTFSDELQDALADTIAQYHLAADRVTDIHAVPAFSDVIDQNFLQLDSFHPALLPLEETQNFRQELHASVKHHDALLVDRIKDNWVRWGHGDLHLQNICVLDGKPMLFDAIEYQDAFVISDILYDVSFLLMDLWERGLRQAANRIFNRYLLSIGWMTTPAELSALKLLPFYLAMRAGIRTHVAGNRYLQSETDLQKTGYAQQTKSLFEAAQDYLHPKPPRLIAIGGYSGSGKSTLAANIAPHIGAPPGAVRLRSDVVRRRLIGWDDFSPMPPSAYTPDMSEKTYRLIEESALCLLGAGHSVIMDAVLDRPEDKVSIENCAQKAGVPFSGLWLDVRKDIMTKRIESRTNDASDATTAILEQQLTKNQNKNNDWAVVNGNGSKEEITQRALKILL